MYMYSMYVVLLVLERSTAVARYSYSDRDRGDLRVLPAVCGADPGIAHCGAPARRHHPAARAARHQRGHQR
jgi:hypothetical protein